MYSVKHLDKTTVSCFVIVVVGNIGIGGTVISVNRRRRR